MSISGINFSKIRSLPTILTAFLALATCSGALRSTTSILRRRAAELEDDSALSGFGNDDLKWIQIGEKLTTPQPASSTKFGVSVSLSEDGKRVAIGSPNLSSTGFVLVFDNVDSKWQQVGKKEQMMGVQGDRKFGRSVSLSRSGHRLATGSRSNNGVVSMFEDIGGNWKKIGDDIKGDFGDKVFSVAISGGGQKVAIDYLNKVRLYEQIGNIWKLTLQIVADDGGMGPVSLARDGKRMAIGDPYSGTSGFTGHVRIYDEINGTWQQVGKNTKDLHGWSVDLCEEGHRIAIGLPRASGGTDTNTGIVKVYEEDNGRWQQIGDDIKGDTKSFMSTGWSVSLSTSGKRLAIGVPFHDTSGSVQVYEERGGAWYLLGDTIGYSGRQPTGNFGYSVSLSGDGGALAVGDPDIVEETVTSDSWASYFQGRVTMYTFGSHSDDPTTTTSPSIESTMFPSQESTMPPSEVSTSVPYVEDNQSSNSITVNGSEDKPKNGRRRLPAGVSAALGSVAALFVAAGFAYSIGLFDKIGHRYREVRCNMRIKSLKKKCTSRDNDDQLLMEVATNAETPNNSFDGAGDIQSPSAVKGQKQKAEESKNVDPADYEYVFGTESGED